MCGHWFLYLSSFLICSWPHRKPFSNQPYPLDEAWKYLLSLLILPEFKILEKTNKTKSQNEEKNFNFLRPFRKIQINICIHTLRRKKATGNLKIRCVNLSTSFVILAIFFPPKRNSRGVSQKIKILKNNTKHKNNIREEPTKLCLYRSRCLLYTFTSLALSMEGNSG